MPTGFEPADRPGETGEQTEETLDLGRAPDRPGREEGGFDFLLLGVLLALATLIAVQNLWLRRRARSEGSGETR